MPEINPAPCIPPQPRSVALVLGAPIDVITPTQAIHRISGWAAAHESRVVCICNVHSVVTATNNASFMGVIQRADMATPDGAPVAWMLQRLGAFDQPRVSGPELMEHYCNHAAAAGQSIFLLGSTPETLARLQARLLERWPTLRIAGAISPPFRPLSAAENEAIVQTINSSGAGTVWVSLGCPKQEQWMDMHRGRIHAVMVGVGAAFDFHAGTLARAPRWMRANGLEWLHRLATEPRRLWKRYAITNSAFIVLAVRQLVSKQRGL